MRGEFDSGQWARFAGALETLGLLKLALIDAIDTDEAGAIGRMMQEHRALREDWTRLCTAMDRKPGDGGQ